jgi:hypothetical protein
VLCTGAVLVIVVLAIAMLSTFRSDHQLPSRPSLLGRATAFVDRFGPAASIGRRNATGTRENRLTLAATVVTITGLVAAMWFTISLVRLGDDAGRWGYTWSSSPDLGFSPDDFEKAVDTTIAHPGVAGIGLVEFSTAVVDERPTSIAVIESLRGSRIEPRILSGQMPRAWREIALGESTARSLGVGVGDVVTVGSVDVEPSEWSVVGLVVPPLSPTTTRPGDGAYTTLTNAAALFPDRIPDETLVALAYAPGVDDRVLETSLAAEPGWVFGARSHARRPGAVANLLGVSVVLWWMVGFFLVFGMCATAACAARRSRRQVHDLVVLRALGFTRRDAVWSALAEATATMCLGVAVGLPLGLVMGRASWQLSAGDLGVDDAQSSVGPVAFATIAVVATVVAVVLVTASCRALRMRTAALILRDG